MLSDLEMESKPSNCSSYIFSMAFNCLMLGSKNFTKAIGVSLGKCTIRLSLVIYRGEAVIRDAGFVEDTRED